MYGTNLNDDNSYNIVNLLLSFQNLLVGGVLNGQIDML